MVELVSFNKVQPIEFGNVDNYMPESQREREEELQERAGLELSTDYEGVRNRAAVDIADIELEDTLAASEMALKNGANPEAVSRFVQDFQPTIDPEVSLEMLAGRREAEDAILNNPVTYQNAVADGIDEGSNMAKNEIVSDFVQRVRSSGDGQSFWKTFGEWTRVIIDPQMHQIRTILGWLPEEARKEGAWTSKGLGELLVNYVGMLWDTLDEKQFAIKMRELGDALVKDGHNSVMLNDAMDFFEQGGDQLLDAMSWAEAGSIGASIAKKSLKMLTKAGNTEKLAAEAAEVVSKSTDKTTVAKEIITPTMTKAVQNPTEISAANTVSQKVGETVAEQTAEDFVKSRMLTGLYSQDDIDVIKNVVKEEVINTFKETSINPVDVMLTEQTDGTYKLSMLIGTYDGNGVDSRRAHSIAKRLGLGIDEWELVKKDGRGFFVQVDRDVTNTSRVLLAKTSESKAPAVSEWTVTGAGYFNSPLNWLVKHFAGITAVGKEARARAVEAERILQGITTELNRTYRVSFNKLSSADKKELNTLFKEGLTGKGKWFTKDELDAKHLSNDVQHAYFDFKRVSDIEFYANNLNVRKTLMRHGFRKFGEWIGKEVKIATTDLNKAIVKDLDGNIVEDLSKYNDAEHILVKISKGNAIREGLDFTHVVAPRSQLIGKELPAIVTHYQPGGRRIYTRGTMFVKIGSGYYNPVTKRTLNGFAKTMIAGEDRAALQQYADEVNELIRIYKQAKGREKAGAELLASADFQYLQVDNWDQVKELVKSKKNPKGIIDTRYRAQVLENKQLYDWGDTFETVFDDVSDADESLQELLDVLAGMNSPRGNILADVNGGVAKIVDIDEVYDKTIRKAAYTMAKSELVHWYAEELNKFSKVIDNWKELEGLSDIEKLSQARPIVKGRGIMNEENRRLIRAAERFLGFANRTLNARTIWDVKLENAMTVAAKIVDCSLPDKFKRGKMFETISKTDPSKVGRAMGFMMYMGLWNLGQFVKQGMGAAHVFAAHPKRTLQAFDLLPFVRLARGSLNNKGLYNFFKKSAMKVAGITDKEFDDMLEFISRHGAESASGLITGADRTYGEALKADAHWAKKIWDSQYVFMNAGNALNFYLADIVAFLEKKGKPWREIVAYSDAISLIPSKATQSAFQYGQYWPTAVIAQWKSYPTRVIESMFDKELTKEQKMRIIGTHLTMWGIGGTFLNEENRYNMYSGLTEFGINPVISDIFVNGGLGAGAHVLGFEMSEGIEVQNFVSDIFDVYDATEGSFQMPAIPAAKAIPQALAILGAIKELLMPTTGDYDVWRYMKYIATKKNLPSSLRNYAKGALALRFQEFYDNRGRTLADGASTIQAVAQMFGFGPYEGTQSSYMFYALEDHEKTLEDAVEAMKPFVDAIHFNDKVEDKREREEKGKYLQEEFEINYNMMYDTLLKLDPEGKLIEQFASRVSNNLRPQTKTVVQGRGEELRRKTGDTLVDIILRKSKGEK